MLYLHSFPTLIALVAAAAVSFDIHDEDYLPTPPPPEPISITTLPLPPVVNDLSVGACSLDVNPHGTGCTANSSGLQGGSFTPDGAHVLATVRFTGPPAAPNPASIFSSRQVILLKADGSVFSNGDAWKCVTCGVPEENRPDMDSTGVNYGYPQAFADGRRVLAGTYIIDCGEHDLTSPECVPEKTFIRTIRLEDRVDGSGPGAALRELRLHPDNVHLGFNVFSFDDGRLGQTAYIARLHFNPVPGAGDSRAARYDLTHVNQLHDPKAPRPVETIGHELHINHSAIAIGELRGFSGSGDEVMYLGYPAEACNIDVFAAHLTTGGVRRLTSDPGYVDPVQMSPDDGWMVIMDTRGTDRTLFMDGLRGIPPITDMVTATACASVRNNGHRRFFQPWLLDRHGDRGGYFGQEINGASAGVPGSGAVDDPEWNGGADPWFSPDGTKIAYWQAQTVPPACGGQNPLPCYDSKEPGGRQERLMVAHLASRKPSPRKRIAVVPDSVPWAVRYRPGEPVPRRKWPSAGTYLLKGRHAGFAHVEIAAAPGSSTVRTVAVAFNNFSDDGLRTVSGYQDVSQRTEGYTLDRTTWYSDIVQEGIECGTQKTGPDGFHLAINVLDNVFQANGTLVTEVDGRVYQQPADGT